MLQIADYLQTRKYVYVRKIQSAARNRIVMVFVHVRDYSLLGGVIFCRLVVHAWVNLRRDNP